MNTPIYQFSQKEIINNYNFFKKNLDKSTLYYALKANANSEIIKILNQVGCHFEAASKEEFDLLLELGISVEDIIFGLPIKPKDLIIELANKGCKYFVFDSIDELEKLEQFSPASKKILRIYITDILDRCVPYGMYFEDIITNLESNKLASRMDGVSYHITTNNNIFDVFSVFERVEVILKKIRESKNGEFILNIGGGYPTRKDEDFFIQLNKKLDYLLEEYDLKILSEPGRSIVNSAGKYISEIILIKKHEEYFDLYIDGGEPHGISLAKKIHLLEEKETNKRMMCRIIGMTCKHKILGITRLSKDVKVGDHIVFDNCGAYTLSERSDFHLWDKPIIQIDYN